MQWTKDETFNLSKLNHADEIEEFIIRCASGLICSYKMNGKEGTFGAGDFESLTNQWNNLFPND